MNESVSSNNEKSEMFLESNDSCLPFFPSRRSREAHVRLFLPVSRIARLRRQVRLWLTLALLGIARELSFLGLRSFACPHRSCCDVLGSCEWLLLMLMLLVGGVKVSLVGEESSAG